MYIGKQYFFFVQFRIGGKWFSQEEGMETVKAILLLLFNHVFKRNANYNLIHFLLQGLDETNQEAVDKFLLDLDGTENKSV